MKKLKKLKITSFNKHVRIKQNRSKTEIGAFQSDEVFSDEIELFESSATQSREYFESQTLETIEIISTHFVFEHKEDCTLLMEICYDLTNMDPSEVQPVLVKPSDRSIDSSEQILGKRLGSYVLTYESIVPHKQKKLVASKSEGKSFGKKKGATYQTVTEMVPFYNVFLFGQAFLQRVLEVLSDKKRFFAFVDKKYVENRFYKEGAFENFLEETTKAKGRAVALETLNEETQNVAFSSKYAEPLPLENSAHKRL